MSKRPSTHVGLPRAEILGPDPEPLAGERYERIMKRFVSELAAAGGRPPATPCPLAPALAAWFIALRGDGRGPAAPPPHAFAEPPA